MTHRKNAKAFTLIEATLASVIVAGVLVASLNVIGAAAAASTRISDRDRADLLARDLMSEILTKPYADPEYGQQMILGPDLGESIGSRILFDDADDYNGWNASPPQHADGTPMAGLSDWSRAVTCTRLTPHPLAQNTIESEVIQITVTVRRAGTTLATAVGLRAITWEGP